MSTNDQKTFIYSENPLYITQAPSPCYIFRYPNPTAAYIIANGIFEKSLIEWSLQFAHRDKLFLDIGAHAGTYSIHFAPLVKQVHAFECQRQTFYQLCGSIALNSLWNIHAHNYALGPENKKNQTIYINSKDGGETTILHENVNNIIETDTAEMRTLDSFELSDICFIKIDVEGFEKQVLMGARETLKRSNYPPILFECSNKNNFKIHKQELFEFIKNELKYNIYTINFYDNMFLATTN